MPLFSKIKLPVILFEKLGKKIAISTATGDFYDISKEAYDALNQLNRTLSERESFSQKEIETLAHQLSIPDDLIELFPIPDSESIVDSESRVDAYLSDITLNLTSVCNLRCIYCWNDQGKYSNSEFKKDGALEAENASDMTVETAQKSVDFLIQHSGNGEQLVVDFYGGEPLMNMKTLKATVEYCRGQEKKTGKKFHFLLATNGTLLTPEVAESLIDSGVQIAVSIDGPGPVHDHNRPFQGNAGSFEIIKKNLSGMPDRIRKRLVGRTTVTPYFSDMVVLYDNLRSLGFERIELFESEDACHKLTPEREKIFFNSEKDFTCLSEEYRRLSLKYVDEVIKGQLDYKKTFFNRFFKLMQRLYYHHEVSGGCPAALGQMAVTAAGDLYPCTSFLGVEAFKFGNVYTGFDKSAYDAFVSCIKKRFSHCAPCDYFSICRTTGSCLNMNQYFNGDVNKPYSHSCNLFIQKLQLAMAALSILSDEIPDQIEELFGYDPVGHRGNEFY